MEKHGTSHASAFAFYLSATPRDDSIVLVVCAGRGVCDCNQCKCSGNWTGPTCGCSFDTSKCHRDGVSSTVSVAVASKMPAVNFTLRRNSWSCSHGQRLLDPLDLVQGRHLSSFSRPDGRCVELDS